MRDNRRGPCDVLWSENYLLSACWIYRILFYSSLLFLTFSKTTIQLDAALLMMPFQGMSAESAAKLAPLKAWPLRS
jgi:hypothetical protein